MTLRRYKRSIPRSRKEKEDEEQEKEALVTKLLKRSKGSNFIHYDVFCYSTSLTAKKYLTQNTLFSKSIAHLSVVH